MVNNLQISYRTEQRSRIGCDQLRKLYREGITGEQLARAGIKKSDLFVKKETTIFFFHKFHL
jgi:hypothetical protein